MSRWIVVLALVALVTPAFAQERQDDALSRQELDARLNRQLYFITVEGVQLFNPPISDPAGCYRLWQGSLKTIVPLLDHRPEVKANIESELQRIDKLTNPIERARGLRKVIDDTRTAIENDLKAAAAVTPKGPEKLTVEPRVITDAPKGPEKLDVAPRPLKDDEG